MEFSFFLIGIIFAIFGLPLINDIGDIISVFFEMIKSSMAVVIFKNNTTINADSEGQKSPCIGFHMPNAEENYGDTEDKYKRGGGKG